MHDDHTPRRFPWLRLAFGGISILVLIGSFGGFMWLLRTYVDPPRIASIAPMRLASADAASAETLAEPRVIIMASRDTTDVPLSRRNDSDAPSTASPSDAVADRPAGPNAGPGFPSWAQTPLPGAPPAFGVATSPPASADTGAVSFNGPVPLPRPKPRMVVRVQLPAAAPLPRPRPRA